MIARLCRSFATHIRNESNPTSTVLSSQTQKKVNSAFKNEQERSFFHTGHSNFFQKQVRTFEQELSEVDFEEQSMRESLFTKENVARVFERYSLTVIGVKKQSCTYAVSFDPLTKPNEALLMDLRISGIHGCQLLENELIILKTYQICFFDRIRQFMPKEIY